MSDEWSDIADPPCFAVDMTTLDGRNHHILCWLTKGHDGDHRNPEFSWPQSALERAKENQK